MNKGNKKGNFIVPNYEFRCLLAEYKLRQYKKRVSFARSEIFTTLKCIESELWDIRHDLERAKKKFASTINRGEFFFEKKFIFA